MPSGNPPLRNKTSQKEFGLTSDEIIQAIRAGKLQYRRTWIFGNPCLRLLCREVEALVKKKHGGSYLKDQQRKTQLARINREPKRLKTQITTLEKRKLELASALDGEGTSRVYRAKRKKA